MTYKYERVVRFTTVVLVM